MEELLSEARRRIDAGWKSVEINELAAALSKAQGEFRGAVADSANPFFKSKYADLGSVWESVRGPLTANGLSVTQLPCEVDGDKIVIQSVLLHSSGQWISSRIAIPTAKRDPQAYGSAYTYARRYGLQALLCVPTVDDDAESAMVRAAPRQDTKQPNGGEQPMFEAQRRKIWALCQEAEISKEQAKEFITWAGCVTSHAASDLIDHFSERLNDFLMAKV